MKSPTAISPQNASTGQPRYSAVIIHYRRPELLAEVTVALDNQVVRPSQKFIVDNGGFLPEADAARYEARGYTVIRRSNDGYAAAVNAVRLRLSGDIDHLLLLTHDVEMDERTTGLLQNILVKNTDVAVVGPMLIRHSTGTIYSAGGLVSWGGRVKHLPDTSNEGPVDVDWVDGAIMMVRRSALDLVGWLDEDYFLYYEEVDLCARVKSLGMRVAIEPKARALQEPGNYTPYLRIRNQLLFGRKNGSAIPAFLASFGQLARTVAAQAARGRVSGSLWALRGFVDGTRMRPGLPPATLFAR